MNLPLLARQVGLTAEDIIFCDQYRTVHFPNTPEKMGEIISCFDVLLSPSAGEGFGICVVEAQACGVPVIVSDFSAQPELVGAGWLVEGVRVFTPAASFQFSPSVPDILAALKSCHGRTGREVEDGAKRARAKALEYDVDRVFTEFMLPALAECEKRFKAREPQELKAA